MQNTMQLDFDGLIQLLAHHLYSEKPVFIRELIQNAHDSILRRKQKDNYGGRIDIETYPNELRFVVRDNGIGMNDHELQDYLSTVGKGATRLEKGNIDGLIGQFGIGFLSAFVVANRVEVRTRRFDETQGWLWANTGSKDYQLDPCEIDTPGTTVTVFLNEEERGVIQEEEVKNVIRRYADMLSIPIHLNGSERPINTMHMPWEKIGCSQEEIRLDCRVYLEKTMRDSVLEVIPLNLTSPVQASGVLYITRARAFQVQVPRTVRLFLNRMFLCEDAIELLPKWAQFINGVINTTDLTPTAARDNFIRDSQAKQLQEVLGDLVIKHLEKLSTDQPDRFSQILRYQHLAIKAACYYHEEFFAKFVHLLEWRTNRGSLETSEEGSFEPVWHTLPGILAKLPKTPGKPQDLPYFSDSNSANQYFQMADAAGTWVIDASYNFESQLIEQYAKLEGSEKIRLLRVDREEDPSVFRRLQDHEDSRLKQLAEIMSQVVRPGGSGKLRVEARYFEPKELAAMIRSSDHGRGQQKAESLLNDPDVSEDLREMAQEMLRMVRGSALRLVINASNPLIRRLAKQEDLTHHDLTKLMIGVYNNAILYNQELMTPQNAKVFHDQFHALLERSLEYIEEQVDLAKQRDELNRERDKLQKKDLPKPKHLIFFMMAPAQQTELINQIREVIEDRLGCQLFVVSDRQYQDRRLDNFRTHLERADAFIAEVTEADPDVMFELGAAKFDLHSRPLLLLKKTGSIPKLPADLAGSLFLDYQESQELEAEILKTAQIKTLLEKPGREHYLSARELKKMTKFQNNLPEQVFQNLAERYPTRESWKNVNEDDIDIKRILGKEEEDCASLLIKRVQQNL